MGGGGGLWGGACGLYVGGQEGPWLVCRGVGRSCGLYVGGGGGGGVPVASI